MEQIPAYHPEWLLTFWFRTPGLNQLNPHYTLAAVLTCVIIMVIYMKKKKATPSKNDEENHFFQLLTKKKILESQLAELSLRFEEKTISKEQYEQLAYECNRHLEQTRQDLRHYT